MVDEKGNDNSEIQKDDLHTEIEKAFDKIQTRDDLIDFIELLQGGVEAEVFDKYDVGSYLDSIATVLFGLEKEAADNPDWHTFGRALFFAFYR